MSFLGLRKARGHAEPAAGLAAVHDAEHARPGQQTPSIKSTSTFRKRLSSFNVFAPKRFLSQSGKKGGGVGYTTAYTPSYTPSRSPSPEPSLEIRRPSGLGRRASITGSTDQWWADGSYPRIAPERKRSISTPELSLLLTDKFAQWEEHSETDDEDGRRSRTRPMSPRIPLDVLKSVVSFVAYSDLPAVALTCKTFLEAARTRLYRHVDLLGITDQQLVDRCINLLASRRELAAHVHSFSCASTLPENLGNTSPLPAVTFAIALNNMHNLTSLTLTRFDSALLFHTTFRLRHLTFLCETAPHGELEALFTWLTHQPTLKSLSFPRLSLDPESSHWFAGAGSQLAEIPEDDPEQPARAALPPTLIPALEHLGGPAPLVSALAPGRPLTAATVQLHTTIYDGLRPSALAAELARSTAVVTALTVVAPLRSRVDARTIERVLMAAGAELGAKIKTLGIECPLDEQVIPVLVSRSACGS